MSICYVDVPASFGTFGTLGHGAVTHACPALAALAYACGIMGTCPQTHSQSSIAQCFIVT